MDEQPAITSAAGATFTEGSAGIFTVSASGVPSPTITESGTLPNGVEFKDGALSGTPTQEGVFAISFTATNEVGFSTQSFTLPVDAAPTLTSAPDATFSYDAPGTFAVTATGTPAPTIESWGDLPAGVSYADGVLSGTPTQIGSFQITFTASNGVGADSVQHFTLTVVGLHVTTNSLPDATIGVPYTAHLQALGGVSPYRWKLTAGKLPKGFKLSKAGVLSGTAKAKKDPIGPYPITVEVTDATRKIHQTATAALTLNVG